MTEWLLPAARHSRLPRRDLSDGLQAGCGQPEDNHEDLEPAHDFAKSTIRTVRDILEAGAAKCPGLEISIRSIKERS